MKHADRFPILQAAFLIAAVFNSAAAQTPATQSPAPHAPASHSTSHNVTPRTSGNAESRLPASEISPPAKHKTFHDLAKSKGEDKGSTKPAAVFAPWTVIGALAIVVGLILVLSRFFRKHAPLFQQSLPAEALEILGRRFVDQRQTILLVRIGSRILVVGSSANGLQPLGELSDPVEVDLIAGLCRRDANQGGLGASFLRLLQGQTHSRATAPAAEAHMSVRNASTSATATGGPYSIRAASRSQEPSANGLSHPENDLRRRLRGTSTTRHEESPEGVRD